MGGSHMVRLAMCAKQNGDEDEHDDEDDFQRNDDISMLFY